MKLSVSYDITVEFKSLSTSSGVFKDKSLRWLRSKRFPYESFSIGDSCHLETSSGWNELDSSHLCGVKSVF